MGLEDEVKETWGNNFRRIFNIKKPAYEEIASKSISALSIEDILLQLGHDNIIPLQDFRKEFEQVYNACLLACLAHHGKNATQRGLARRLGVSATTIKDYEPYYKLIHARNTFPQGLFFTTLSKVLKKDNRSQLARACGKLVMEMFPHYMRVIEDEGCGIPYLKAAFDSLYSQIERNYVGYVMSQSGLTRALTARQLGVTETTVDNLCARYGLVKVPRRLRNHVFCPPGIKDKIMAYLRSHKYSMKKASGEFGIPASQLLSIAEDEFSVLRQRLFDAVKSGQLISAAARYLRTSARVAWFLLDNQRNEVMEMEKRNIQHSISATDSFDQAARQLGIQTKQLYRKRAQYGMVETRKGVQKTAVLQHYEP